MQTLFYQPKNGYCYNSDTIFLYSFIKTKGVFGKLLDVGSGSGVLGILLKRDFPKIELVSVEIQKEFHNLTLKNSEINNIQNQNYNIDFLKTNFINEFDFIVSNPPFYRSSVIQTENLNINIARYNHHLPLEPFFQKVAKALKPRGYFIFCYDPKQFQEIAKTLSKYKLQIERVRLVYPTSSKSASLAIIETRKNSKSDLIFEPPLINFSDEVKKIYKSANTYTIKF